MRHTTVTTVFEFTDLGVVAVDDGGAKVHLYRSSAVEALGGQVMPFHALNLWDHEAGQRIEVTPGQIAADAREAAAAYGGGGDAA